MRFDHIPVAAGLAALSLLVSPEPVQAGSQFAGAFAGLTEARLPVENAGYYGHGYRGGHGGYRGRHSGYRGGYRGYRGRHRGYRGRYRRSGYGGYRRSGYGGYRRSYGYRGSYGYGGRGYSYCY